MRKPTHAEYAVIILAIALSMIGFGSFAVILAVQAPQAKSEIAHVVMNRGACLIGVGVAALLIYWGGRRLRGL